MSERVRLRVGDSAILPKIIEGISPDVELTQQTEGVMMTVTTKSGTKSALIPRGPKGDKGDKGDTGDAFTYADFTEAQKLELIQGPIQTAQTAAVSAVNEAGASQVAAVEAKGDQVIDSIPADYAELSGDVDNLKSAITVNKAAIRDLQSVETVAVTMNRYRSIGITTKQIYTDAGGGFYLSTPVTVAEGELYRVTGEGYGTTAAFALGNNGVVLYTFPESVTSTSAVNYAKDELILIPAGVTELYVANTTYGEVTTPQINKVVQANTVLYKTQSKTSEEKAIARNNIGSPSVDELNGLTKKEIDCIEATDTGSYETAPSTVAKAHPFEFASGGTYIATLKVISGTFRNENDIIRVQQSASTGTGTSSLLGFVFRLNDVTIGETYTQIFTAQEGCVNLLARYKFDTGTQNIELSVKRVATVKELIDETSKKVDSVYSDCTIKSRMLMGAHRGAEYYAPPNCVAAYEIAGKMGFPWAWLAQIRWSSTGTLYVMHDADVSITTNGTGNIQDLTDEYIDSLLCNKLSGYDYSEFTDADLRVPTLEKAIQICLRYGMKMCFRIEPFPNQIETELQQTIWDNFETLVKAYGIPNDWCCFSGYNTAEMARCVTLFGEDANICPYLGAVTAQDVVDWFNSFTTTVMRNKSVLLSASNITLSDVKLLHTNGIKVYAFTNSSAPTQARMEQFAAWGVDILQNPKYARIPS